MIAPRKPATPKIMAKRPNLTKPLLLVVVIMAAIVAIVALLKDSTGNTEKDSPKPKKPTKTKEVAPSRPRKATPKSGQSTVKTNDTIKPKFDANGRWIKPANWDEMSLQDRTRSMPVGRTISRRPERPLFKTPSDNKIFRLLHTKPGAPLLGTMRYDQHFVKEFLESLKEPIIYDKDDTDEEKRAKIAVQQARQELKEAYDRGEDIAEIMRETEDEMHKLAIYKINLQSEFQKALQDNSLTDDEVRDFAKAANILLEEKGLDPIRLPKFFLIKEQLHKGDNK